MLWIILNIVGCIGVTIAQTFNRKLGVGIPSWIIYSVIAIGMTYYSFAKSFALAPSFVSAWFVCQVGLGILGVVTGYLVFKESISLYQWIGIVLSFIGGYFLIK